MYDSVWASMVSSKLVECFLAVFLLCAVAFEAYLAFLPVFQYSSERLSPVAQKWSQKATSMIHTVLRVTRDFRSGIYYNPFRRAKPVIIRSPDAMQELSEAAELSQRAVYADIFGFKYTMSHNDLGLDPNEQISLRYRLFARAIKIKGSIQINLLHPYLETRLQKTLNEYIDPHVAADGWHAIRVAPLMRDFATGMMGIYFFGKRLSEERDFSAAMSRYYHDTVRYSGALQIIPNFLQSLTYSIITNKGYALGVLFDRLHLAADPKQDGWKEDEELKSITLFQNMIEGSKDSSYWTHATIIQATIGIWFAASHQPWINLHFVFLELCARPKYIEMIRGEIRGLQTLDPGSINSLQILDSFIKESVRTNALDKMSIRRKALKPFTFSNGGPHVAVGQIACVSAWDMMHNESIYHKAHSFDGLRFVKSTAARTSGLLDDSVRGTTFTDASTDFPIWGLGSKVCPGRWHSALVIKMVLIHLIKNYDFRLEDKLSSHKWSWETFQMPYESSKVLFRKRPHKCEPTA